jgi:hypothetical protein
VIRGELVKGERRDPGAAVVPAIAAGMNDTIDHA